MGRKVGGSGWSLVVAGGLALVQAAPAQQHSTPAGSASVSAAPAGTRGQATNSDPQIDAMRIEMALMAEPATFQCEIHARFTGDAIELHGFVPSDAIRGQAVLRARHETSFPIRDCLAAYTQPLPTRPKTKPEALTSEAAVAFHLELGEWAKTISVQADQDGKVILNGEVASFLEKAAAGIACRKLMGCSSVVNHINVLGKIGSEPETAVAQASPTAVQPAAVPAQAVVVPSPASPPIQQVKFDPEPAPPVASRPQEQPAVIVPATKQLELPIVPSFSAAPIAENNKAPSTTTTPMNLPDSLEPTNQRLELPIVPVPPPAKAVEPSKTTSPPLPAPPATERPAVIVPATRQDSVPSGIPAAATGYRPTATTQPIRQDPARQANGPSANGNRPLPLSPAQPQEDIPPGVPASAFSYRPTAGNQPIRQDPVPAGVQLSPPPQRQIGTNATPAFSPPAGAPRIGTKAAVPVAVAPGSVSTGSISFVTESTPEPVLPIQPPPGRIQLVSGVNVGPQEHVKRANAVAQTTISPELLQKRIESVCGWQARNVRVEIKSETEINLFLKVRNRDDGVLLYGKICEMPELAPLKVHIEMDVEQ